MNDEAVKNYLTRPKSQRHADLAVSLILALERELTLGCRDHIKAAAAMRCGMWVHWALRCTNAPIDGFAKIPRDVICDANKISMSTLERGMQAVKFVYRETKFWVVLFNQPIKEINGMKRADTTEYKNPVPLITAIDTLHHQCSNLHGQPPYPVKTLDNYAQQVVDEMRTKQFIDEDVRVRPSVRTKRDGDEDCAGRAAKTDKRIISLVDQSVRQVVAQTESERGAAFDRWAASITQQIKMLKAQGVPQDRIKAWVAELAAEAER